MYLSRFAHFFINKEDEEVGAFYHAINLSLIFFPSKMWENFKKFEDPLTTEEFLAGVSKGERGEYKRLLNNLIKNKFLISSRKEDENQIFSINGNLPNSYPQILYLMLADGCNLACRYCFEGMNQGEEKKVLKMTKEVALKSLQLFSSLILENPKLFPQKKSIIFYGGEPMLNFDCLVFALKEITKMKKAKLLPRKLDLVLITNGTLIDSQKAAILKKYKVNVSISLDGNKKHNVNRVFAGGKPAFPKIIKGYKLCRDAGVSTSISCTISESNVNEPEVVVKEILKRKISFLGFNVLLGKSTEDYQKKAALFITKCFKVFQKKNIFEDRMYRKLEAFSDKKQLLFDCGAAGGNQLVISPEGTIGICHGFFKERKYFESSVFSDSFHPLKSKTFITWRYRTPFIMSACWNCEALAVCGGGCPMNAEKEYGSIWEIDKRYCEHSKQSLDFLIWDLYNSLDKQ